MKRRHLSLSRFLLLLTCLMMGCLGCASGTPSADPEADKKAAEAEARLAASEKKLADLEAKLAAIEQKNAAAETDKTSEAASLGYVVATDFLANDGKVDVADAIQKVIDDNPNRTIYFPDGVYLLSKPICTPADPSKGVDLKLSNYAILRASPFWKHEEAMVRLGGKDAFNDISTPGSNYSLSGGIIDGNKVAKGVSIDSGRETRVENLSIKNTTVGLTINKGANSGSSDADILNVNIYGAGGNDSIGVLLIGLDNTLTNMRIANVHIGVKLCSAANSLRNIHPLYIMGSSDYESSIGFYDISGDCNWYDFCYSDQFACGFYLGGNMNAYLSNCFCFWYSDQGGTQVAMRTGGKFNSLVSCIRVGGLSPNCKTAILEVGEPGGQGTIEAVYTNEGLVTGGDHRTYLTGKVVG